MKLFIQSVYCLLFTITTYSANALDTTASSSLRTSQNIESASDTLANPEGDAVIEYTPPLPDEPTDFRVIGDFDPTIPAKFTNHQSTIDYDLMGGYIESVLSNHVVGYAYVVNGDGVPQSWNSEGHAKTPADGGLNMSVYTRSDIASVTKQITSVASVKILEEAGLSIETKIKDYLPNGWSKGSGVNDLEFKDLLTHSTGWGQLWDNLNDKEQEDWNNDWDGLKYVISLDASPGSSYSYKNANTALLRILIPKIWVAMGGAPYENVTSANHELIYLAYIQHNIFNPIGIYNVTCWLQPAEDEALAYSFDHVNTGGISHETSLTDGCGGHAGLRLSAVELAKYLAYLRHSHEIITASQLALINQQELGWDYANDGKYTKGGYRFNTTTVDTNPNDSNGVYINYPLKQNTVYEYRKASRACVAILPYGVEASLIINSEYEGGDPISTCGILLDAFNISAD
ncbi:MAG: serine hydrolase [Candidatus Thiodiazotropha sp. DIVDIV]